jgi:hypothetical protein
MSHSCHRGPSCAGSHMLYWLSLLAGPQLPPWPLANFPQHSSQRNTPLLCLELSRGTNSHHSKEPTSPCTSHTITSLTLSPHSLHSSQPGLQLSRHTPASGPLHLPFPVCDTLHSFFPFRLLLRCHLYNDTRLSPCLHLNCTTFFLALFFQRTLIIF